MAITTATLSGTITDVVGEVNPRYSGRIVMVVESNTTGSILRDTVGNVLMAGAKRINVDGSSGAYSQALVTTDSPDIVPADDRLYRVTLIYPSGVPGKGNVTATSGWFALTADTSLADVWQGIEVTAVSSAVYASISESVDEAAAYAAAAEAARDGAVAIAGPVDATVEGLIKNTGGIGPLTSAALSATYVTAATSPIEPLSSAADAIRPLGEYVRVGQVAAPGGVGEWDQCMVESAKLLWVPERQQYLIVYTGYDGTPNDIASAHSPGLGFAWSDHRYGPFAKDPANPILAGSGTPGDPDEHGVTGFMGFQKSDGSWTVYSIGLDAAGYEGGNTDLCRYTTPDLASPTWTRHGVAIANGGTGWRQVHAWIGSIVERAGTFHMFLNGTAADLKERVGHASSSSIDGPWTVTDEHVLDVGTTGQWDDKYAAQPDVHRLGDTWYMAYYGYQDGAIAQDGLAYCHDDDFPLGPGGKWTKHPSNPIVTPGPDGAFDSTYTHKPFQTWFPSEIIHLNTAVKDLGSGLQARSVGMISFGARHVGTMYPLGDQATARTVTGTSLTPVVTSSVMLDGSRKFGLQLRIHVRANPGGGTLTIQAHDDGTAIPTEPVVTMSGAAYINASSPWVDLDADALFDAYLIAMVDAGTATIGHAAYEFRWVAP